MHREEGREGWLAGTIVCLLPGTVQVCKSQSLTNGSLVLAALDLRRKARAGTAEGQNPLSEQPSGRKSFHRKQRRTAPTLILAMTRWLIRTGLFILWLCPVGGRGVAQAAQATLARARSDRARRRD